MKFCCILLAVSLAVTGIAFPADNEVLLCIGVLGLAVGGIGLLLVLIDRWLKKRYMDKEEKKKKETQDELDEKARKLKAKADAYVYTPKQLERLAILERVNQTAIGHDILNPTGFSIDDVPSDLRVVIGMGSIGIFDDEILPSKAMKEKYHLIPTPISELSHFLDAFAAHDKTMYSTHQTAITMNWVDGKQKSVVGGAVKGAVVAGSVGAIVGAVATADKNAHAPKELLVSGGDTFVRERHVYTPCMMGIHLNAETGHGETYDIMFKRLWIHGRLLEQETIRNGDKSDIKNAAAFHQRIFFSNIDKWCNQLIRFEYCNKSVNYQREEYLKQEVQRFIRNIHFYGHPNEERRGMIRNGTKVAYHGQNGTISVDITMSKSKRADYLRIKVLYGDSKYENYDLLFEEPANCISPLTVKQEIQKLIDAGELEIIEY